MSVHPEKNEQLRVFIAANLDQESVQHIAIWVHEQRLCSAWPTMSLVVPERYHLTLCHAGERSIEQVTKLNMNVKSLFSKQTSLRCQLDRVFAFPSPTAARSLALRVTGASHTLELFHQQAILAVNDGKQNADPRVFEPHITLARFSKTIDITGILSSLSWCPVACRLQEVGVFRSDGVPKTSAYQPLLLVPLLK
jgi:2'-5' RNA ligase